MYIILFRYLFMAAILCLALYFFIRWAKKELVKTEQKDKIEEAQTRIKAVQEAGDALPMINKKKLGFAQRTIQDVLDVAARLKKGKGPKNE